MVDLGEEQLKEVFVQDHWVFVESLIKEGKWSEAKTFKRFTLGNH